MTAPVKNVTVDGVEVPVTTPAYVIKGAGALLTIAPLVLSVWNPWNLDASSVTSAILLVLVVAGVVAFFGQTLVAAIHKYGWSKTMLRSVFTADKAEVESLLPELRETAAQAKPVLDAAKAHSDLIASAMSRLEELEVRARKLEQTPALDLEAVKSAIVAALTGSPETPASAPVSVSPPETVVPSPAPAPAPVQPVATVNPVEVSTGGTP